MADLLSPQEIIRRADRLKADRTTTEGHWDEIASYIMPSREFQTVSTPGEKRMTKIYHIGPVMAAEKQAGALHGMLTSIALRWFVVRPDNLSVMDDIDARAWFDQISEMMFRFLSSPHARFALNMHENYLDLSAFGTAVLFANDRGPAGPGFRALPLSECLLSENDNGELDTLYRTFSMRAQDVVAKWGDDVPEDLRRIAENRPDERWDCVHGVIPDGGRYMGQYVLKRANKALGKMERYEGKPFIASRWSKRSGEIYGASCAMNALPVVKRLNRMEEEELRGVMLATRPPIALPDDGFLSPLDMQPGRANYYRSDDPAGLSDRVFPLQFGDRPDVAREKIMAMETWVEQAHYIDWMSLPFRPNMTATEVLQRRDDMLRLMGPMVARLQTEMLGPVVERTYQIMSDAGMLPPPPSSLSGAKFHIEYLSPLSLAQKSQDAQAALQFMAAIGQVATGDPTVLDRVDADEFAKFLGDRMGAPAKVMRTDAQVIQLRQARAERDQMTQNAMAADAATKALQQGGAGAASLADAVAQLQGAQAAA